MLKRRPHIQKQGLTQALHLPSSEGFKRSKISSGIDKKQFKNAPNITLPKFFESNLPRGFPQLKLSSLKYQPTAFPDITKLNESLKIKMPQMSYIPLSIFHIVRLEPFQYMSFGFM